VKDIDWLKLFYIFPVFGFIWSAVMAGAGQAFDAIVLTTMSLFCFRLMREDSR
jgi:hypothetical protein